MAKSKFEQTLELLRTIAQNASRAAAQAEADNAVPLFDVMKVVSQAKRLDAMFEVKREIGR